MTIAATGRPTPASIGPIQLHRLRSVSRRVADLVAQFGFTNSEVKTSPWTGDPDLWVKDPTRHFRIAFGCDPRKRLVTINVDSEQNQVGSAADLLDTLINSLTAP